jgi:hypothetical protein
MTRIKREWRDVRLIWSARYRAVIGSEPPKGMHTTTIISKVVAALVREGESEQKEGNAR